MQHIHRRQYTDDFKAQAGALAKSIGRAKATRQLDISVKTLANGLDAARDGRALRAPSRQSIGELESEVAYRSPLNLRVTRKCWYFHSPFVLT